MLHWYWQSAGGGIDRVVRTLARRQADNPGLDIRLATGRAWDAARDPKLPPASGMGFRHGLDFLRLGRVRAALRDIDLLHMHSFNPVVALAARQTRTRVIYTDHGSDRSKSPRNLIMQWLLQRRFVGRVAALVTSPSRFAAAGQEEFYARKIRAVENGLEASSIRARRSSQKTRAEFGLSPRDFVIGTAAVFQERKRLPLLLKVFAEFERLNPHARARLLIAGDGWGADALRDGAAGLGIADRTVFCGFRRDVHDVIAAMDTFVLPTKGEPFGLAAVEAMLLQRPVIVFKSGGGLVEVVRDGETGYIVPTASKAVRALEDIYRHPRGARELGRRARAIALRRFGMERMERSIYACYQEAVHAP